MSDIRARDLVRADEGLISRRIFFDPEIYRVLKSGKLFIHRVVQNYITLQEM